MRCFPIVRLFLVSLFLLLAASPRASVGQIKINCDTPSVTRWSGDSALSIEAGKQDCEEAKRLADRASALRKDVKEHNKKADTEAKRAKALRDEAGEKRKEADRRAKEATDVLNEARREVNRMQEHSDAIASWGNALSIRIPFQLGGVDTVAVPSVQGIESDAARNDAIAAFESYAGEVNGLAEAESEAVTELSTYLEQEATSLEARAGLHEQRASRYRATVSAAERAAERLEIAARVSEDGAILHQLNATLRFLALNQSNADAGKELDKGVKFVEAHLGRLPMAVSRQASELVAAVRGNR